MKSFIAALRSLVLPYGRTSGERLVLDGVNGRILVYNSSDALSVIIDPVEGVKAQAGGTYVQMTTAGGLSVGSSDYDLSAQVNVNAAGLTLTSPVDTSGLSDTGVRMVLRPGSSTGTPAPRVSILSNVDCDVEMTGRITAYGAPLPWTPVLSGGGAATYTTVDGWYQECGGLVYVYAYFVVGAAGSGASVITMNLPVEPWRGSANRRQTIWGTAAGSLADGPVSVAVFAGGSGATVQRFTDSSGTDITGARLPAGAILTVEGWYRPL